MTPSHDPVRLPSSTFAPLAHPDFRRIWIATLASSLGTMIQAVAAGWLMTTLTDSVEMVALVQSAATFPVMLLSLISGALADNYERRQILVLAQLIMLSSSAVLAGLVLFGMITPWLLIGLTFVTGVGTALHNPSWQASVGDLVPRADIPSATSLNGMGFNLMRSIGPALGGLVVVTVGATFSFCFNALTYLPLIIALIQWKPVRPTRTLPREHFFGAVFDGVRYVLMSPTILTVLFRATPFGIAAISLLALLPAIAGRFPAEGALAYGAMLGAFGAGGIIGATINSRLRARLSNEAIVRIAALSSSASALSVGFSDSITLSLLLIVPAGAGWVIALSLFNAVVQLSTPRWVVGRAVSIYQTGSFGGMALGGWIWGSVADAHGTTAALLGSAVVLILSVLSGIRFRLADFSDLDLAPVGDFQQPSLQLDLRARSGPIKLSIEYDIDPSDVTSFLAVMARRRRVKIRDGARRWALLRDLENPRTWMETYHFPTWYEYVRHNDRSTRADAEITTELRQLHRGEGRPRVHRMIERHTIPPADDMPLKPHTDIH